MTDSRDEHERYGYTPSVSEGDLPGWLRSEADYAARMPAPWVMLTAAADTIERLIKERDEARKYSCELEARIIVLEEDRRETSNKFGTNPCSEIILPDYPLAREPKEIAKQKGWDCYKDESK